VQALLAHRQSLKAESPDDFRLDTLALRATRRPFLLKNGHRKYKVIE